MPNFFLDWFPVELSRGDSIDGNGSVATATDHVGRHGRSGGSAKEAAGISLSTLSPFHSDTRGRAGFGAGIAVLSVVEPANFNDRASRQLSSGLGSLLACRFAFSW